MAQLSACPIFIASPVRAIFGNKRNKIFIPFLICARLALAGLTLRLVCYFITTLTTIGNLKHQSSYATERNYHYDT